MTNLERLQKSQEILKSLTVDKLRTPEGQSEFNQAAGECIRDSIRKTSLFYKVIPPQPVTKNELKKLGNTTDDQPDIRCLMPRLMPVTVMAMLMDMRGEPIPKYIDGKQQLPIPMRTVETKRFEKTDEELSGSGILKVVEEMASWEAKERDKKFLKYCELAVTESGQVLRKNGPLQRSHFRKIQHPALLNEINPEVVLLSEVAFIDLDLPDSATEINNMTCIRSIDNDVLASTEVWSFPAPDSLGYNLYCGDYKVCNKRERADLWSFQGREMIGAGIGNINGITKKPS